MTSILDDSEKRQKQFDEMRFKYQRVFDSVEGRAVLEDIAMSGVLRRSAFNIDGFIMAFNEGKRDLAQHILDMAKKEDAKPEKPKRAKRKQVEV